MRWKLQCQSGIWCIFSPYSYLWDNTPTTNGLILINNGLHLHYPVPDLAAWSCPNVGCPLTPQARPPQTAQLITGLCWCCLICSWGQCSCSLGQNHVKKHSNDLAVQMKEFLSGVIYWYDAALKPLVTLSGHRFWFMPLLIAIIYYFRCSSNKEPRAEQETLVLDAAQKQSKFYPKNVRSRTSTHRGRQRWQQHQGAFRAITSWWHGGRGMDKSI